MPGWFPQFQDPQRLWWLLLLPALIVAYLVLLRLKGRVALRFTNTGMLGRVVGSQRRWTRHLAVAMSLCSLIALGLAYANPLGKENVPRERATVVMVIDTSMSMSAEDVSPNRLDAAKAEARQFIAGLPASFNVAVVELNGTPSIAIPPTTDRGATQRAIDALQMSDGTAIGDAITVSLKAVDQAPSGGDDQKVPAMLVLLSDGTNTDGADPKGAADQASERGIPIYTISYGTQRGYVDLDGKRENVAPDPSALEAISKATGGESTSADNASSLREAYQKIGSVVGYEEVSKPITGQYAFFALGFAVVAALGAIMMAARWPR